MFRAKITSAAIAAAIALTPATRVAADGKDFLAGAIIGGVVGSQLQKNANRNRAVSVPAQRSYAAPVRRSTARSYVAPVQRQAIPATGQGRDIQSSLNYFGFNAGTVDGQIGSQSRAAIASYQAYMGYDATGQLTSFERELLLRSHVRAQAGGEETFRRSAASPDGRRGLLKDYRTEFASGVQNSQYSNWQADSYGNGS